MKDIILQGNALDRIKELQSESVDCIVTSPPYYGLRSYLPEGHPDKTLEIGLEESPEAYIEKLVSLFRECRRVLKDTGTFWLNLGDSYWGGKGQSGRHTSDVQLERFSRGETLSKPYSQVGGGYGTIAPKDGKHDTYKSKDLMMIPARVALALQADGWWLRSAIVWHKVNAMPESIKDRPTNDYEMVYLLTKSSEYFYDTDAIREPHKTENNIRTRDNESWANNAVTIPLGKGTRNSPLGRNKRAVWAINTRPYQDAHFATMPQELADTCIKAGCPKGGVVLDPFGGAGTTTVSAISLKRHYILIELNAEYIKLAQKRIDYAMIAASQLELWE